MLFTSITFLFYFLPVVWVLHWLVPSSLRNSLLLFFSLIFYWWGSPEEVGVLLTSILFNWLMALSVHSLVNPILKRRVLQFAIGANLMVLIYYKYFQFLFLKLVFLTSHITIEDQIAPLGISFFTFHAISYIVDTYNRKKPPFLNPIQFGLYISLFPQLIAGPIIRFHDIADQITARSLSWELMSTGCERFIFGLGKKILIADNLSPVVDFLFAYPGNEIQTSHAWFGLICFSLQIYYDFSGYSDMAIGLARMFGFTFLENFNYPYLANSITDFWQRWHLSLSTWLRDYLYIPLGGDRVSPTITYRNLFIVFILCGLWHGANWTFLVWGIYHGMFLTLERRFALASRLPWLLRHVYALVVIMVGWLFFRHHSVGHALGWFPALLGFSGEGSRALVFYLSPPFWMALGAGLIFATPAGLILSSDYSMRKYPNRTRTPELPRLLEQFVTARPLTLQLVRVLFCLALLVTSTMQMAMHTAQSFIYFQF